VERRRELQVEICPSGVLNRLVESLLRGTLCRPRIALVAGRIPGSTPFEQLAIAVGLGPVLVDAVIPLAIRNRLGGSAEKESPVVELEFNRVCDSLVE